MSVITLTLMGLNAVTFSVNYDYDELGRLIGERGNNGQNIRYAYDAEGRLVRITDSQNRVRQLSYDALGQMVQAVDPANGTTHVSYDPGGRVARVSDARGLVTTYEYDGLGNLWKQASPDTGITLHQYDAVGLRVSTTRSDGSTVAMGYDGLGRLASMQSDGQRQDFSYDWCAWGKGMLYASPAPTPRPTSPTFQAGSCGSGGTSSLLPASRPITARSFSTTALGARTRSPIPTPTASTTRTVPAGDWRR
ncbi:YD repeat-containing protein [Stenotrophomonas maltophilia]|nr:YD repeat-containing protein [Stenotrophomonas maltophilia]